MNINFFLDQLEFENLTFPNSSMEVDEINVEVESNYTKKRRRTSIYIVNMYVYVKTKCKNEETYTISINHCANVNFEGNIPDEDKLNQILNEDVPRKLYEHIRALVWNLSSESGFSPIMLRNYDEVIQEQALTSNTSDDNEIMKNDNADEKEDSNKKSSDDIDLSTYEHPVVCKYLNLFRPIKYRHPHLRKCDERIWRILSQLLFAVGKNVEVVAGKDKSPEIEFDSDNAFTNSENKRRTISSLMTNELKILMSYLETKLQNEIPHEIMNTEMDKDYADKLSNDKSISKEDLLRIFNVKEDNSDTDITSFIHKTFERVAYYELQTLPYNKV